MVAWRSLRAAGGAARAHQGCGTRVQGTLGREQRGAWGMHARRAHSCTLHLEHLIRQAFEGQMPASARLQQQGCSSSSISSSNSAVRMGCVHGVLHDSCAALLQQHVGCSHSHAEWTWAALDCSAVWHATVGWGVRARARGLPHTQQQCHQPPTHTSRLPAAGGVQQCGALRAEHSSACGKLVQEGGGQLDRGAHGARGGMLWPT